MNESKLDGCIAIRYSDAGHEVYVLVAYHDRHEYETIGACMSLSSCVQRGHCLADKSGFNHGFTYCVCMSILEALNILRNVRHYINQRLVFAPMTNSCQRSAQQQWMSIAELEMKLALSGETIPDDIRELFTDVS